MRHSAIVEPTAALDGAFALLLLNAGEALEIKCVTGGATAIRVLLTLTFASPRLAW